MSPSEHDLRAALHHGDDDDSLSVDHIVASGRAARSRRRTRLLSAAASVVVVAAAGTTAAVLLSDDGNTSGRTTANQDAGGGQGAAASATASAPTGATAADGRVSTAAGAPARVVPVPTSSATAGTCPSTFPRPLLAGGGSPGQFGASGPLFAQPVESVTVCGYGADGQTGAPSHVTFDGTNATTLVTSAEAAAKRDTSACSSGAAQSRLALVAMTADGAALRTVTLSLDASGCAAMVTNGTAIRYDWTPPAALRDVLLALTPSGAAVLPTERPARRNVGTPIHN